MPEIHRWLIQREAFDPRGLPRGPIVLGYGGGEYVAYVIALKRINFRLELGGRRRWRVICRPFTPQRQCYCQEDRTQYASHQTEGRNATYDAEHYEQEWHMADVADEQWPQ